MPELPLYLYTFKIENNGTFKIRLNKGILKLF